MILAIDTSQKKWSLTILDHGKLPVSKTFDETIKVSENLITKIDDLLKEIALPKKDLTLIAVNTSPGSLTGIRVGIAVGKGLAFSLGVKFVGISLLKAMSEVSPSRKVVTILNSGKNKNYLQIFEKGKEFLILEVDDNYVCEFFEENILSDFVVDNYVFEKLKHLHDKNRLIEVANMSECIALAVKSLNSQDF